MLCTFGAEASTGGAGALPSPDTRAPESCTGTRSPLLAVRPSVFPPDILASTPLLWRGAWMCLAACEQVSKRQVKPWVGRSHAHRTACLPTHPHTRARARARAPLPLGRGAAQGRRHRRQGEGGEGGGGRATKVARRASTRGGGPARSQRRRSPCPCSGAISP